MLTPNLTGFLKKLIPPVENGHETYIHVHKFIWKIFHMVYI
jgi:hypothetical protein